MGDRPAAGAGIDTAMGPIYGARLQPPRRIAMSDRVLLRGGYVLSMDEGSASCRVATC